MSGQQQPGLNVRVNVMNWKQFDAMMEERNPLQPSTRVRKNGLMMAVDVQRPHLAVFPVSRAPMPYDKFLDARRRAEGKPRADVSWAVTRCKCGRPVYSRRTGLCKGCSNKRYKANHEHAETVSH